MVKPSKEDLQYLEANTRFTDREIHQFYSDAEGVTLSRKQFDALLDKSSACDGPDGGAIRDRMFAKVDEDGDGMASTREVIHMLSSLQRGTQDELCRFFFDMYDLDSNKQVTGEEIIKVYQQLLQSSSHSSHMTQTQKEKVWQVINRADTDGDGQLNFKEFLEAIKSDSEARKQPLTCGKVLENIFLVVVTSLFEMGTSFSLPATSALSLGIQNRYDVTPKEVGNAAGVYFAGAMIGPLLFGILMDRIKSPIAIVTYANILVVIGSGLQAAAPELGVLYLARAILGFAGESTPFGTVESLQRLFPNQFLLMAGVRNLVQSSSTFLSFVLLPAIAGSDNSADGTRNAMWFCFGLAVLSLIANVIVWAYMRWSGRGIASSDEYSVASSVRQYAKAITPKPPTKWAQLRMPPSLIPAMLAIQAFYYPPFAFTAFTNDLFPSRFDTTEKEANVLSGAMSLIGGWLGPLFGPLSDYLGNRSVTMAAFMLPSVAAFIIYATTTFTPWVGIALLGLTYGWGDTVSYSSIRLLVGTEKAGLGYGLFGLVGNIFGLLVPIFGGWIFTADNGEVNISWYFAGMSALGALCWAIVRVMEGPKSAMELPAAKLIETEDKDINNASLYTMLGPGAHGEPAEAAGGEKTAPEEVVVGSKADD